MNLNLYEKVTISHDKTWIDPVYKKLYSKEIKHCSSYTILKRYNPKDKEYDYFIAVSDAPDSDHFWSSITTTRSGIIKIDLSKIWNELRCSNNKKEFEVIIEKVDEDNDGAIYYLDI